MFSQNCLLLDRLEAVHITAAEQGRKAASTAETESSGVAKAKEESDLQNVIRYLRRSKETVGATPLSRLHTTVMPFDSVNVSSSVEHLSLPPLLKLLLGLCGAG